MAATTAPEVADVIAAVDGDPVLSATLTTRSATGTTPGKLSAMVGPQPAENAGHLDVGHLAARPGVESDAVARWLTEHIAGSRPPYRFTLLAGGRSNLTYRVVDAAGNAFVLRRPPLGHLLPSAHDMSREHRIISALRPTGVPVAAPLGFCDDPQVSDRPFYVMSFVDGHILRNPDDAAALPVQTRRRASESVVDVLVDLHALDVDAIGLGSLGKRDGYIERQLKRWHGQFGDSKTREVPLVDDVHERLLAHVPMQQGCSVVHGDYRLDNTLIDAGGKVAAVLDWEICTLGDPLADLGLLLVYWPEAGDTAPPLGEAATQTEGFATKAELRDRYGARSGRDVSQLDYYLAFGYWKLACILEGVYARYRSGAMGEDGYDFTVLHDQVPQLADAAHETLRQLERAS